MPLDIIPQRQLNLGAAAFFRPEPEDPPGNQIIVRAGWAFRGAFSVEDRFTAGDQTTAGFASVASGVGFKRYDLVYADATGLVQILQGNDVAAASADFTEAPGQPNGPDLPDQCIPVAYVLVDETGAVTVDASDITQITGFLKIDRDLDGYYVDKGFLGSPPAGTSDDVSALFGADTPGGSQAQRGIITTAPLNFIFLVDQAGNELQRAADNSQVFGRLTEVAGTWTLAYLYLDSAGAEQPIDPSTDCTIVPTDVRLIGVPEVFSRNDPGRPLFASSVNRFSDVAAGDIPVASPTIYGKVKKITDGSSTDADAALATTDARVGAVQGRRNADAVTGYQPVVRLIEGTNVTISLVEAGGELQFTINASTAGAFPGFGGVPGADTAAGSAGGSGLASHSNHNHPRSDIYRIDADVFLALLSTGNIATGSLSFRARFGIVWTKNDGGDWSFGAWGVNPGGSVVQMANINTGASTGWSTSFVGGGGGGGFSSWTYTVLAHAGPGNPLNFTRGGASPGVNITFGAWTFGDKFQ